MLNLNVDPTEARPRWAHVARLTTLAGLELLVAEAQRALTIDGETFAPLEGCEIDPVKHIINGEVSSTQINFAHAVGGTFDTAELNRGFWDGAGCEIYLVDKRNLTTLGDPIFAGTVEPVTIDPIGRRGAFDLRGLAAQAANLVSTYQPMCIVDLFSSLCTLDKTAFAQTGTVGAIIDHFTFVVAGLAVPPADGWFNGGTFEAASGYKGKIETWVQGTLRLRATQPRCLTRLTEGEGLTLYPGCDKLGATCRDKFDNKRNFIGWDHFFGAKAIFGS